jgi:hypothetical protein
VSAPVARARVARLAARLRASPQAVRAAIAQAQAQGFVPGARVRLADGRLAIVQGPNPSAFGFFTGDAYPVLVRCEDLVFECAPDEGLTLVDAPALPLPPA